jgi:hypothetical protein
VIDGGTTGNLTATNYGATVFANYSGGQQPSCGNPNQPCLVSADFSPVTSGATNSADQAISIAT